MSNGSVIPNAKVLSASGLGAIFSSLVIDVLETDMLMDVSISKQAFIVWMCAFIAGYLMPEKKVTYDEVIKAVRENP